ncbi:hypothetical protein [Poriferisphaera sp. WC338]|uniref:hypothetical protein n=1 Tax=Poriferisphaera sp. WC338 TaxID=3425129 RepID=UPI003D8189A6
MNNANEVIEGGSYEKLPVEALTWTAMLGHWVEFARSAVGLPASDAGQRMRASVGDVIMLQAVWYAVQKLDVLAEDERAIGLDRAGVLIEKHAGAIEKRWHGGDLPEGLTSLIVDAKAVLVAAREASRQQG